MAPSDSQSPNAPVTRPRGSGGDVQSKGISIPDAEDAEGRKEPEGASAETSSGATAKEE